MENDPEAYALLEPELEPGERLLWTGRPPSGLWSSSDILAWEVFSWAFGLIFAFMAGGTSSMMALDRGDISGAVMSGLFFGVIGLGSPIGTRIWDRAVRRRTCYGISNRRVLVRRGLRNATTMSYRLDQLVEVALREQAVGTGTIDFAKQRGGPRLNEHKAFPPSARKWPVFDRIANARAVYMLLDEAIAEAPVS